MLLSLLLLAGCGAEPDATIRFGVATGARNLDPRLATDATSERVNRLLYRRLVEFDAHSLPTPGIARWEQLSPTSYRFTLGAEGRQFSDSTWLTAADVAATYRSILDPDTASPHRALLSIIEQITVLDPDRLEFRLREADPLFPAYLGIGICPAARIDDGADLARAPVGSGPYELVDWPAPGRLLLRRRADGQLLELVTVQDPNVRVMKLLRGEVDLLQNDLPPELVAWLRRQQGVRVETAPGVNFSYLGFNLEDPATGVLAVRQAVAHAIDRGAILRWLFQGAGREAEAMFPPEHWAGARTLPSLRHDPALARRLLQAAGYGPDRPLRLTLKASSDPFRLRLATVVQAQLADVGIELAVQSYDWGTFFGDIKAGRFQLYGLTWVGVRTPDIFRYVFHSASIPPDGANRGRYRSPVADDLIERARAEPDLADQATLYRQLQALLLADLPYVPLWYEDQIAVMRTDLEDYRLAPDGNYDALTDVRRKGMVGDLSSTRP